MRSLPQCGMLGRREELSDGAGAIQNFDLETKYPAHDELESGVVIYYHYYIGNQMLLPPALAQLLIISEDHIGPIQQE